MYVVYQKITMCRFNSDINMVGQICPLYGNAQMAVIELKHI